METFFAPAARDGKSHIVEQSKHISNCNTMHTLVQSAPHLLLVINSNRQIVAFNEAFIASLGMAAPEEALGLRLGEVLYCKYAFDEPGGCGTTQYCSSCGAAIATMAAIDNDRPCERKCALAINKNGQTNDFCLLIRSQPVVVEGARWILLYAQDISQQQHWANLEKEFLQDLDNKLCYVQNYSHYVQDKIPTSDALSKLTLTIGRVVREIRLQDTLKNHHNIASFALIEVVSLLSIRNLIFSTILNNKAMMGKNIEEDGTTQDVHISTDPVLVSRVTINMLINALEATEDGGTVKLKTVVNDTHITWHVWNCAYIPENIQLRIFQKYFSTKSDTGHGLGTYRMKLMGEKYLGGTISFESKADSGTTFSYSVPKN